jgi:hypothetical protein
MMTSPSITLATLLLLLATGQAHAHGGEDHSHDAPAPAAAKTAGTPANGTDMASAQRLADGGLFVPKAVQHRLGLRTQPGALADLAGTVAFNGRVIADPNASGRVQASQDGRVEPGPRGFPTLGQRVVKGQILAWLRPVAGSIERGNQQALLAEIESQLAIAERRLARHLQLEGAIPRKEIESTRIELEALTKRRAAIGSSLDAAEALRAPVSGVISAAQGVAGQVVEARETLFEVVDPARLAVEALAYDPALADGLANASAAVPGGSLALRFVGAGRKLREQALPLLFRIQAAPQNGLGLAVGQPLKVVAQTPATIRAVALPMAALGRDAAGESLVWVKQAPEYFAPHRVAFQPLDASRVAVTSGLADGERVVTTGASLLSQVR